MFHWLARRRLACHVHTRGDGLCQEHVEGKGPGWRRLPDGET